jgi:uncharacterized protein YndB with AHSA1/START domain
MSAPFAPDPALDLLLVREVDVPAHLLWRALTTPELLMQWFCPRPWKTVECGIDLRPGGIFRTVMESPEGVRMDEGAGCYLEVVQNERLVWTTALGPGFRPTVPPPVDCGFLFTAVITLEAMGARTTYSALAIHMNPEDRARHEAMGFFDGWGTALDQLVEVSSGLAGQS